MILIAAADDSYGMMFNHRRQSQDRVLRQRMLELTAGHTLWMNAYSTKQFAKDTAPNIRISEAFLDEAHTGEYCFIEDMAALPYEAKVEKIVLYRWNRAYPGDFYFDIPLEAHGWKSVQATDFPGSSHACITEEQWIK